MNKFYIETSGGHVEEIEKAFESLDDEAKWIAAARGGDTAAGEALLNSIKLDAKILKTAQKSSQIAGSTLGSLGESRFEAINAKDEFIATLQKEREEGKNKYTDREIEQAAISVGNSTFVLNAAYLSISNFIQFREYANRCREKNRIEVENYIEQNKEKIMADDEKNRKEFEEFQRLKQKFGKKEIK